MDEPSFLLRAVTWHIGSGDALLTGWLLMMSSVVLYHGCGVRRSRTTLISILALVWLILADALSVPVLVLVGIATAATMYRNWFYRERQPATSRTVAIIGAIIFLIPIGVELPYHWPLRPVAPAAKSVAVIGDSVSAGLNAKDVTWPRQLAQSTGRVIYDASQQGATVKSALTQLEQLNGRGEVLWIEIGGNDILESLPVSVYAERLEALLQSARNKYRTIVMMEIPAPPGGGGYGVTQRVLSKKYDIPLVPKRQFLAVLTSAGSTQDGVHLANAGHQRMAALVQKTLGWTNGQQPGEYQRIE
ncbi:MAG TPA: GDSL-type esterase/lipase family protein [Planctomycetaceae bacterium]|nr:GDSL-type esterase/lipase family protein [Planctomycetaceae bacterium]